MKHVADGLKYTLKWTLFVWSDGPIPPNLGELTEWMSVLLQILIYLEGQIFWGKWGEITRNYPNLKWWKLFPQINQEILKASKNNHSSLNAFQLICPLLTRICWGNSTGCFIYSFVIQEISEKTLSCKGFTSNLRDIFTWK